MADLTASTARQVLPAAAAAVSDVVTVLPTDAADAVWQRPSPCGDWTAKDVLNHLTAEHLWVPHLLGGETIEQVGDRYEGDVPGEDPRAAWERAVTASLLAWAAVEDEDREVQMSSGPVTMGEYARQMNVDLVVHGWDLARSTGMPCDPAPEAVAEALDYERPRVDGGRVDGIFSPPVPTGSTDPLDQLVALLGRDPSWGR